MPFWGDVSGDLGAGLSGEKPKKGHPKRVNPLKRLPTASQTSSAKGRSGRAVTAAPPRINAKGGELAPLRIPDYGRDRVLSDAKWRQSTKESHPTANSWSLSGMIGGLGWSEKRDARSRDAWHSGRHRRMMNNNKGGGLKYPDQSKGPVEQR